MGIKFKKEYLKKLTHKVNASPKCVVLRGFFPDHYIEISDANRRSTVVSFRTMYIEPQHIRFCRTFKNTIDIFIDCCGQNINFPSKNTSIDDNLTQKIYFEIKNKKDTYYKSQSALEKDYKVSLPYIDWLNKNKTLGTINSLLKNEVITVTDCFESRHHFTFYNAEITEKKGNIIVTEWSRGTYNCLPVSLEIRDIAPQLTKLSEIELEQGGYHSYSSHYHIPTEQVEAAKAWYDEVFLNKKEPKKFTVKNIVNGKRVLNLD